MAEEEEEEKEKGKRKRGLSVEGLRVKERVIE